MKKQRKKYKKLIKFYKKNFIQKYELKKNFHLSSHSKALLRLTVINAGHKTSRFSPLSGYLHRHCSFEGLKKIHGARVIT